jgi:hypothetical protein
MAKPHAIFISYRRSDTTDVAGRLYDRLKAEFGSALVFKDVDAIPFGTDFGDHIQSVLRGCRVQLTLIGRDWLDARDASGARRLDSPTDWVRIEIETALNVGVQIIPLLVSGASMPAAEALPPSLQPLRRLNAAHLRADPDFHADVDRLVRALRAGALKGAPTRLPGRGFTKRGLLIAGGAVGAGAATVALWPRQRVEENLPIPDGFYLVSEGEGTDAIVLPMRGSSPIQVSTAPLIEGRGLRRAGVVRDASGRTSVAVEFNERGAAQMRTATAANIGRRLAVVVYGSVVMDAVIQSPISEFMTISGDFSESEASAIAARLNRRA